MANTKRVQLRRGTTAEHASFIGAEGELTIDITRDIAIVHDGVKLGGHELVGVAATNQSIVNKVSVGIGTSNATSALTVFGDSLITGISTLGISTFIGTVNFGNSAYFGDNDALYFGDGSDLKIIHTGSESIIADEGTGPLYIRAANAINFQHPSNGEYYAIFNSDGSSELYFNNSIKFGTTGVGVSIFNGASTTATLSAPAELIIDPAAVGDNTGSVRIKGDLYVDGTTTTINSTALEIADAQIGIASAVGTNAILDGAGIGIGSTNIRKTISWNNTAGSLTSSEDWNLLSGKQYKINGTSVLTSTTLGSGVVNSSLTSVGILTGLSVSGNLTASGNNATIQFSPTGAGTVTINPATTGSINNVDIGGATRGGGNFNTLTIKDNSANFVVGINPNSSTPLTANRLLNLDLINASRTLKLAGNLDIANNFTTSGNFALTLTSTNTTIATLPPGTITLVDLSSSQALTNKTISGLTVSTTTGTLTIANGKTLTTNNSITFAGTDATTMTFPSTSGTVVTTAETQSISNKALSTSTCDFPVSSSSISNKSYVDAMTIAFGC